MDFIHNGGKLCVFGVSGVYRVDRVVEILHVFGVHFEKWRKFDHDIPDSLVALFSVPQVHPFSKLTKIARKSEINFISHIFSHATSEKKIIQVDW